MFEWIFGKKRDNSSEKIEVKRSFDAIKHDMDTFSNWIRHLNSNDEKIKQHISDVNEELASIKDDIEGLKNALSFLEGNISKPLFKQRQTAERKQAAVQGVQIPVQTAVQTGERYNLLNLSSMERALVFILANTELKLSYDDLAAMTGKSRATIRGQVNTIKQKSEGLIEEIIEANGKKRVFIPEEIKEKLLKNVKVRAGKNRENKGK